MGIELNRKHLIAFVALVIIAIVGIKLREGQISQSLKAKEKYAAVPLDLSPSTLKAKQPPLPSPPTK